MVRTLSRADLMDMLYGAAILGTGGGGEISEGEGLIDEALAAGKTLRMVTLDEAPEDALICTPYMLGAISDVQPEEEALYADLPRSETHPILLAYDHFEDLLGQHIWGTVPCELGGSNTAIAFYVAAMRGGVVCDADPAGRAVPEITHSTYYLAGLPVAPIVMANAFGETFVARHVHDDQRAETLVRALSTVSRHDIAAIDHALPARDVAPALIPGTLSQAMQLGAVWREAKNDPITLPDVIADTAGGYVAFRGRVTETECRTEAGFTLGHLSLAGTGAFAGHSYRIAIKNENMASWCDETLHATIPELICVLDTETGQPVTNPNTYEGQALAIVILSAPSAFLSPAGLNAFGPSYVGLSSPFRPSKPLL